MRDESRRLFLKQAAGGIAAGLAFPGIARADLAPLPPTPPVVPVERRELGKTDMTVSVLGFGAAEIGYGRTEQSIVDKLLNSALDAGLNALDTAECYAISEEQIGNAVSKRRKDYFLFTKCGHWPDDGWSVDGITRSLERSLERLKTDHVDLLQLHSCGKDVLEKGEVIEALEKVKKAGKTRYIGYSGDSLAARYAVETGKFDTLMTSISIADQEAIDLTLPLAREKGMGVIVKRGIANAVWRYDSEPENGYIEEYWRRMQQLDFEFAKGERRTGTGPDSVTSIAMRFALSLPGVHTNVVGTTKPERFQENAKLLEAGPLDEATIAEIRKRWKEVAKPEWVGQISRRAGLALVAAWLAGCAAAPPDESALPMREFRGMWVATVANIDWPSRPGLNVERMKSEAIEILDRARDLKLNAVVLQVRPHCDALYESALEPWSWYLTGKQGQAPGDSFDPLHFWIRAAHDRGLHLHAWFNPFRALHPAQKGEPAPDSFVARNPALAPSLGKSGYRWLIPTDERVQDHALAVIRDVVRRYDVDGVHLDDYFYPYPDYLGGEEFPDAEPYAAYVADGGDLARDDWRRAAVDRFVERLYDTVKDERETVLVGISPFGIWRPGHPRSIRGFDPYVSLFADAKRWLEHGHLDYCAPQLYWPIGQLPQSFPLLLDWWSRHDREERHLWPGLNTGKVQQNGWAAREIVNQILVSRGIRSASPGHIHFSAKALKAPHLGSDGIDLVTDLKTGVYAEPALVPRTPWLDDAPPRPPATIEIEDFAAGRRVRITTGDGEDPFLFAVAIRRRNGTAEQRILPAHARDSAEFDLDATQSAEIMEIAVSAIDRLGNASPIVVRRVTSQPEDRVSTLP